MVGREWGTETNVFTLDFCLFPPFHAGTTDRRCRASRTSSIELPDAVSIVGAASPSELQTSDFNLHRTSSAPLILLAGARRTRLPSTRAPRCNHHRPMRHRCSPRPSASPHTAARARPISAHRPLPHPPPPTFNHSSIPPLRRTHAHILLHLRAQVRDKVAPCPARRPPLVPTLLRLPARTAARHRKEPSDMRVERRGASCGTSGARWSEADTTARCAAGCAGWDSKVWAGRAC